MTINPDFIVSTGEVLSVWYPSDLANTQAGREILKYTSTDSPSGVSPEDYRAAFEMIDDANARLVLTGSSFPEGLREDMATATFKPESSRVLISTDIPTAIEVGTPGQDGYEAWKLKRYEATLLAVDAPGSIIHELVTWERSEPSGAIVHTGWIWRGV